jgi:hopene-associated glycosyltransferase HpnB
MLLNLIACTALAVWIYLIAARGGFWTAAVRDDGGQTPKQWPAVTAVIPARDEADGVGEMIRSLLGQDYPGLFSIVLVDDQSTDGTADVARRAAAEANAAERLTVLAGAALPEGWTGKLWAMKQGIDAAAQREPTYLLLTDADIVYERDALARLVAKAEDRALVLTSWMVKLRCETFAERALIPAFVFFFEMLYPFGWVNRPEHPTAAAAGGCMLARRDALEAAGGIESIRGALIDDCALAQRMKTQGPIWLSLTERACSTRPYPGFEDIRKMVARSAYAQLRYSPVLLAGTVIGMAIIYLAPVLFALFGHGFAGTAGWVAWAAMAIVFQPILRFYGLTPFWGPFLPAIALVYMAFTLDSAYQNVRGRGGLWKGRVQAKATEKR